MGNAPSGVADIGDMRCPSGKYITKVKTRSGGAIDKLEIWCNDGTYHVKGGGGGNQNDEFSCPNGFSEITARAGDNMKDANVDQLQFKCSDGRWSPRWGGTGGSEYKKPCDGAQVITGLANLGTRNGILAPAGEFSNVVKCDDRVDCLQDANLFDTVCKNKTDTNYQNKVQEYCNRNDSNAKSSDCINWCSNNVSKCTLLNDLNDCVTYGITRGDCSRTRINDVQAECKKYRLIVSDVGATGMYPCNPNSINTLKKDCTDLEIPLDSCSPEGLEPARDRKLQLELDEQVRKEAEERYAESQRKAAERYEQTQKLIAQTMGVQVPSKESGQSEQQVTPSESESDQQMYIIIAIIIICLLCSSSLVSVVFLLPSEE